MNEDRLETPRDELDRLDRDFKRQLDCAAAGANWSMNLSDELLATYICNQSDAIFAERKKREVGE